MNAIRSLSTRIGRRLYQWGRHEVVNAPEANGEYALLEALIRSSSAPELAYLDIGANLGNWTQQAIRLSAQHNTKVRIHCFEPCAGTRSLLEARMNGHSEVSVVALALSDHRGTATFYSSGEGKGTNSLGASSGPIAEQVEVCTLDHFLETRRLGHVRMAKVDAEGFDFLILKGATKTLANRAIDVIQFEYNWRWLQNGASLRAVFDLIKCLDYSFGKLTPSGILEFREWHFELDRFFEGNYVLLRRGAAIRYPVFKAQFDESNALLYSTEA